MAASITNKEGEVRLGENGVEIRYPNTIIVRKDGVDVVDPRYEVVIKVDASNSPFPLQTGDVIEFTQES